MFNQIEFINDRESDDLKVLALLAYIRSPIKPMSLVRVLEDAKLVPNPARTVEDMWVGGWLQTYQIRSERTGVAEKYLSVGEHQVIGLCDKHPSFKAKVTRMGFKHREHPNIRDLLRPGLTLMQFVSAPLVLGMPPVDRVYAFVDYYGADWKKTLHEVVYVRGEETPNYNPENERTVDDFFDGHLRLSLAGGPLEDIESLNREFADYMRSQDYDYTEALHERREILLGEVAELTKLINEGKNK